MTAGSGAGQTRRPLQVRFEQLYRTHYARVRGLCRQLLGPSAPAEDATQEVFMRAYRAFENYDPAQSFASWVFAIASNYCVDVVRRRSKESALFAEREPEAAELEADEPGPLTGLMTRERAEAVQAAIAALPEKYRVPLALACYREASYDEIAELLGVTRNHVGTLILRAKRQLRAALTESEEEH